MLWLNTAAAMLKIQNIPSNGVSTKVIHTGGQNYLQNQIIIALGTKEKEHLLHLPMVKSRDENKGKRLTETKKQLKVLSCF